MVVLWSPKPQVWVQFLALLPCFYCVYSAAKAYIVMYRVRTTENPAQVRMAAPKSAGIVSM